MRKFLSPSQITEPSAYVVEGSTLTIPNLAPSLLELLESSKTEGLPYTHEPYYDDSDEAGISRLNARNSTINEIMAFGQESMNNEEGLSLAPRSYEVSTVQEAD